MKKIISIIVALLMTANITNAQSDSTKNKFFQEVSGGMIAGIFGSSTFTGDVPPFLMGYGLLANITVVTPKTYHNVMYGFGDNSVRMINGYLLPKKWDTYFIYSKVLHNDQQYLGLGLEKMVKAGDVGCFLFFEVGSDFKETNSLTIGVLMSAQNVFWKRN